MGVIDARFGHVNVIARDWRALAAFYERVLGCTPVPPERNLRGPELSAATGLPNAALQGMHLRLPGGGPTGPTLEIFQYDPSLEHPATAANRPGFGHIAFVVPDVAIGSRHDPRGGRRIPRRRGHDPDRRRSARDVVLRHGPGGQHRRAAGLVGQLTSAVHGIADKRKRRPFGTALPCTYWGGLGYGAVILAFFTIAGCAAPP